MDRRGHQGCLGPREIRSPAGVASCAGSPMAMAWDALGAPGATLEESRPDQPPARRTDVNQACPAVRYTSWRHCMKPPARTRPGWPNRHIGVRHTRSPGHAAPCSNTTSLFESKATARPGESRFAVENRGLNASPSGPRAGHSRSPHLSITQIPVRPHRQRRPGAQPTARRNTCASLSAGNVSSGPASPPRTRAPSATGR